LLVSTGSLSLTEADAERLSTNDKLVLENRRHLVLLFYEKGDMVVWFTSRHGPFADDGSGSWTLWVMSQRNLPTGAPSGSPPNTKFHTNSLLIPRMVMPSMNDRDGIFAMGEAGPLIGASMALSDDISATNPPTCRPLHWVKFE
jgi:hypothetical protein